jgi:ribosomal protein S18 acetylase RimI-like enzyme
LGIGKALLSKISTEGTTDVYVDTKEENWAALRMYQKANFVVVKRRFGQILLVLKL